MFFIMSLFFIPAALPQQPVIMPCFFNETLIYLC